jgi:hypothetical protein
MSIFNQNNYNPTASYQPYPSQSQQHAPNLQFYSADPSTGFYGGGPGAGLEGSMVNGGVGGQGGGSHGFGGNIQATGGWWAALSATGLEGEPPLLEELGINFAHIRDKSLTVLNPLGRIDEHIMDDADLAGPIIICFLFALCLLLSGKSSFGYIYGVALLGSVSLYLLLNLMSESGIDAYRVASVLGYCLLPMVGLGAISVRLTLEGTTGYILSTVAIVWCTYAASGIFVAVLRMSEQRLLVAYPIGLLYGCFALLSVFNVGVVSK